MFIVSFLFWNWLVVAGDGDEKNSQGRKHSFYTRSSKGDFTREERIARSAKSNAKCAWKGRSEMKTQWVEAN